MVDTVWSWCFLPLLSCTSQRKSNELMWLCNAFWRQCLPFLYCSNVIAQIYSNKDHMCVKTTKREIKETSRQLGCKTRCRRASPMFYLTRVKNFSKTCVCVTLMSIMMIVFLLFFWCLQPNRGGGIQISWTWNINNLLQTTSVILSNGRLLFCYIILCSSFPFSRKYQ